MTSGYISMFGTKSHGHVNQQVTQGDACSLCWEQNFLQQNRVWNSSFYVSLKKEEKYPANELWNDLLST